jgi:aminomethyltransferase
MQYNLLFDDKGHVLDDLMVYKRASDYFCVVNAANIDKDFKYIQKACGLDCNVINVSDTLSLICVQGPSSEKVLRDIAGDEVTFLKYMAFGEFEIKGGITALISRSGYTGEDGFEIYVDNNYSEALWDKIFQAGDDYGILPCGLASRDILRIEAGYPLYGHELFDEVNPFEVSIKWALKNLNDKICGLELESLSKKAANIRVGIVLTDKGVLRQGCKVFSGGQFIGEITSGTFSSNLDRSIGMAFISKEYNVHNEKVFVDIRGRKVQAVITGLPFIPANTKR